MLHTGELVGTHYRVLRFIGAGGMGEVYEAVHERLSRRVALKTIKRDYVGSIEHLNRFRREAEAAAALGHPNIIQVTDFVIDDVGEPVIVMELLEGRTLQELVATAKRIESQRAVFIGLQVLSGLAAAHRDGIVHRDVKPANIFLQKTIAVRDHVKLLDFGLAKLIEGGLEIERRRLPPGDRMPETRRGTVLGTRAYMAPEQENGGLIDGRADLYALGATLYHVLSGVRPKTGTKSEGRRPLLEVAADIPPKLAAIIEKALAHRPTARWASAEEMAEELIAFGAPMPGIGVMTSPHAEVPILQAAHRPFDPTTATLESPRQGVSESTFDRTLDDPDCVPQPTSTSLGVETERMHHPPSAVVRAMASYDLPPVVGVRHARAPSTPVADPGPPPELKAQIRVRPRSKSQSMLAARLQVVLLALAFIGLLVFALWLAGRIS